MAGPDRALAHGARVSPGDTPEGTRIFTREHRKTEESIVAKSYVILLEDLIPSYAPHHWPATCRDDSLQQARARTVFSGNPQLLLRADYTLTKVEDISLLDARTGLSHRGAIYEAERKTEQPQPAPNIGT
jgi:hypothetical protein